VLEYARTIYPGISQPSPGTHSDSSGEEDEIETIVDSLYNLSPLLVDILENLPGDTPIDVGYVALLLVFLFLLVSLMLLYPVAGHAGRFRMLLESLRWAWFD